MKNWRLTKDTAVSFGIYYNKGRYIQHKPELKVVHTLCLILTFWKYELRYFKEGI